jgi:hypothetical protein
VNRVVGKPGEIVGEPGVGIDVVELAGLDQRIDRRRPAPALVGTGECPIAAPDGNLAFILPIVGQKSKSIIRGIRCTGDG